MSVTVHFSSEGERIFLQNVERLGCTKSDYIRFAMRLACDGRIAPEALERAVLEATRLGEGGRAAAGAKVGAGLYSRAHECASKADVPFSTWMRALLTMPAVVGECGRGATPFIRVGEAKGELAGLRREVLRIGQNCNQIAYALNVCKKKNWLPADHAEGIFGNAQRSLDRIGASLDDIAARATQGISALERIDQGVVPVHDAQE